MRILVTGSNGFSARHLLRYLKAQGCGELYGADLSSPDTLARDQDAPPVLTEFFPCDLANEDAVSGLIERTMPDRIYHLAGTFTNDFDTDYAANVASSQNLLEAMRKNRRACRILLVGSAAEYGLVPREDNPVREDHELSPASIYGLTKVYQTYLGKYYFAVHKIDVVTTRPFNLLGRGVSNRLFVGRVYEQIEACRQGTTAKISVGNLESYRDYIGVEDAVRAYALIMERGVAGEIYNVGSGASIQIRALLQQILRENGLGMDVVEERSSPGENKPDVSEIFADVIKLHSLQAAES